MKATTNVQLWHAVARGVDKGAQEEGNGSHEALEQLKVGKGALKVVPEKVTKSS